MQGKPSDAFGSLQSALNQLGLRLRVWWRLLSLHRELLALETRRDEYLRKLGTTAYNAMKSRGADILPDANEQYLDVRAVQGQMERLQRDMAALRSMSAEPATALRPAAPTTCACGATLPAGAKFCPACGQETTRPASLVQPVNGANGVSGNGVGSGAPGARRGAETRRTCPRCGGYVPLMTDYCPHCQASASSYDLDDTI